MNFLFNLAAAKFLMIAMLTTPPTLAQSNLNANAENDPKPCTLTAFQFQGVGHVSASLSCQDNSIAPLNVGLYPFYLDGSEDLSFVVSQLRLVLHMAGAMTLVQAMIRNRDSSAHYVYAGWLISLASNLVLKSGKIRDETARIARGNFAQKVELKISKEQALKVESFLSEVRLDCDSLIQTKCRYAMIGRNCVDFVQELFEIAGEKQHFTSAFTFDDPPSSQNKMYGFISWLFG